MIELESYFTDVLNGKIVACDKLKVQSERILEHYYNPGQFHFDKDIALRHTDFIETFCKQPSGKLGQPLILQPFQKARLQAIFGFVDDNDLRMINEALIIEGRKNGKTTECAAVELDLLVNDKEGAPQIYNVATMLDQAKLGFNACLKMVKQSPLLSKWIKKRASDLYFPLNMGFIKALASNTNSLDGLDTHAAIIDELAAIKNRDLYDLIRQSTSARSQSLIFQITTNGFVRDSVFDAQYNYAKGCIDGSIKNDRFFPLIYELDSPDEWDKPECYIKANPGLGTIKSKEYLDSMVQKAKDDPTFKPTVMVKDFNMPQSPITSWLRYEEAVNETSVPMEYLKKSYCIGGCDLSSVYDLTCSSVIIRKPNDKNIYVLQHYFIPRKKLDDIEKQQKKEAPYQLWVDQGWITVSEGASVDYHQVTEWFVDLVKTYNIRPLWVCYDRALAGYWQQEMADLNFEMQKIPQGPITWTQPMKEMYAALQEHIVVYQNNPVTRWCLLNTGVKSLNKDGIESIQPVKFNQYMRIDGTVSMLNAWVGYVQHFAEYMPYVR